MKTYQFLNGLRGIIIILLILAFGSGSLYAQHLFSVNYDDLSQDNVNLIRAEITNANVAISTMSMTRNHDNREVYALSLSSVQNTKIIILNEETGNNVVITPVDGAAPQFDLSPFFIEELRQAVLGDADRFLVIEADTDFSVRKATSVSATSRKVFIPRYLYGPKESVQEALPKDRQIVHIFKEKPRIMLFSDDTENLRLIAELEEERSYYVYMYQLPDGTKIIFDEHFIPNVEKNGVSTRTGTNLQFNLSGNLTEEAEMATLHALGIWSAELAGTVVIDIDVTHDVTNPPGASSYPTMDWFNPTTQTWYPSALANQILGYNFAPDLIDICIVMKSDMWYYPESGNPPSGQFDWITVMLHEVAHGLGFDKRILENGRYTHAVGIYNGTYGWVGGTDYPSIFTRQLYQGTTGFNITELTQTERAALIKSNDLFAGRPNSYLLAANSGSQVKIYAPAIWLPSQGISHWDPNVTFPTFFTPFYPGKLHTINAREIAIMRDMGWEVPVPPYISGPYSICATGVYELNNANADSWTVSPSNAFSITSSNNSAAIVTALTLNNGQAGTLTAMVGGTAVHKSISSCSSLTVAISGYNPHPGMIIGSCTGDYYIDDLPVGVSQGTWRLTDNSKLSIIQNNGVNGCRVERKSFYSYDTDVFETPPIEVYPNGGTELIFEFVWNGSIYSVSTSIAFGVTPRIGGIFKVGDTPSGINSTNYILNTTDSYFFSSFTKEFLPFSLPSFQYRWVVTPQQGIPASPSQYSGKETSSQPASFAVPGTYVLNLSIHDGCGLSEKSYQPFVVKDSDIYLIHPNPFINDLYFTRLPGACKSPNIGTVVIQNIQTGALIFKQDYDFCLSFSISFNKMLTGLYLVTLVGQKGTIIQQQTILKN